MIALIDYGAGNLTSVRKALTAVGADVLHPGGAGGSRSAPTGIVIPGVGHFAATRAITTPWRAAILAAVERRRAAPRHLPRACSICSRAATKRRTRRGSALLKGRCRVLPPSVKVPHVGWNALVHEPDARSLLDGIRDGDAGVLHAFLRARRSRRRRSPRRSTASGSRRWSNGSGVFGVQFHPEKSCDAGLRVLRSFVEIAKSPNFQISKWLCVQAPDRLPRRPRRQRRQRRAVRRTWRTPAIPAALARRYNAEGIDELVILDVTATLENRRALAETLRAVSAELFIPLTVGGGIRSEADAAAALDAGADKVALNSAALAEPGAPDAARVALRIAGGGRRHRREARRTTATRCSRAADRRRPAATRSSGRARRPTAARARSS